MKKYFQILYIPLLVLIFYGCIEPYSPPEIESNTNFLVVDGFINDGNATTSFKLTRTRNLSDNTQEILETNASVSIEGETGSVFNLIEVNPAVYQKSGLQLNQQEKYRLRIKTKDNKEYLSEYVEVKISPEIDSLTWKTSNDGLSLFVNTHDDNNNTWYYMWDFDETWEFNSGYSTSLKYEGNSIVYRGSDENVFTCWKTSSLNTFILGTSNRLNADVISNFPIQSIISSSTKLRIKYSILVNQKALTKPAFEYWQNLKRNTESMGTLFDPQPSQIRGNIYAVNDPNEPVIGYVSAGTITSKRIFISSSQLPSWRAVTGYEMCKADTIPNQASMLSQALSGGDMIPIQAIYGMMGQIEGYMVSSEYCVDCTLNGTNKQPAFWK